MDLKITTKSYHRFSTGEVWIGLDALHNLTTNTNGSYKLKVILTGRGGKKYEAFYDWIKVSIIKYKPT